MPKICYHTAWRMQVSEPGREPDMAADEGEDMRLCSPQLQDRNGARAAFERPGASGRSSGLPSSLSVAQHLPTSHWVWAAPTL